MTFVQTRPASRMFIPDVAPAADRREWIMRGANFVVVYSELNAGDVLERISDDEYFAYLPDAGGTIEAGGTAVTCLAGSLAIVPPGTSRLSMTGAGKVMRVFTAMSRDLAASALNADVYADDAAEVAPMIPWPAPSGGLTLRVYPLADFLDRPMRLFRSTNMMINIFDFQGPRDVEALSSHSHDSFEQGSFGMAGDWVHSLRYPWTKRLSDWRDDEHLRIGSPSLLVIPAGVIHTSRATGQGHNQLIDIFSPPRADFVAMGLVCNELAYPAMDTAPVV